jgi:chromosome segregation ATPase
VVGHPSPTDLPPADLELVATVGVIVERRPLLAPPAPIGANEGSGEDRLLRWQLAFSIPSDLVEAVGVRFELAVGGQTAAELSAPSPVTSIESNLRGRLEHEHALRVHAEEQIADHSQDLADARALLEDQERRCAISERNLAELRDKLVLAWTESRELRDVLDLGEARHESTKREVRRRRAAERELRVLLGRQERDLVTARENVERQCEALAAELAQRESGEKLAREELDATRSRETALQEAARTALETFEQARGDTEQTRALLERAEQAASAAATDAERSRAEVDLVRAELEQAHTATSVEFARAEQMSAELERLQAERDDLVEQVDSLKESQQRLEEELTRGKRLNAELEELRSELTASNESAQTDRSQLEKEVETLRSSERLLHERLAQAQKKLESVGSGRRGRIRKALSEAETERKRLESELNGLLLHLGDLEEKLAESKAFDPHVSLKLARSSGS